MVTEGKYTDIIGKKVHVIVDRPAGSYHPRNHDIFYPINYGYIEDIIAGDGSGQDVYAMENGRSYDELFFCKRKTIYNHNLTILLSKATTYGQFIELTYHTEK